MRWQSVTRSDVTIDIARAAPHEDLAALSYRYAAAVDHRDAGALLSVFDLAATLRAHPVGRNQMTMSTHRELPKIIQAVEYWPRTFHVVGQALFEVDGQSAYGEIYCVAHHFSSSEPGQGSDYVMYIRYLDAYSQDSGGGWFITARDVVTDAVERRDVTVGGP
jgi:SnoaL-like domain